MAAETLNNQNGWNNQNGLDGHYTPDSPVSADTFEIPQPTDIGPDIDAFIEAHIDQARQSDQLVDVKSEVESLMGAYIEQSEQADRSKEVFAVNRNPVTFYEIDIHSEVKAEDCDNEVSQATQQLAREEIAELKEELDGGSVWHISSTFQGGGVAMQIPPEVVYLRERGIDAHWGVSAPSDEAFAVTKKMHNAQQDVNNPEGTLEFDFTEEDAQIHIKYGEDNIRGMWENIESFRNAKVYIFDDPQLAGGLKLLKQLNPDAKIIYRNHIHTDRDKMADETSVQHKVYKHIHETCGVDEADTYVSHPVKSFPPYGVEDKLAHQPPVSSLQEELNNKLSHEKVEDKLDWTDRQIVKQNRFRQLINLNEYTKRVQNGEDLGDIEEWVHKDDQGPLNRDREWLTGFARFDWAKAQHLNMELQKRVTDKLLAVDRPDLIPDTIIAGNGATDDGDREIVLSHMLHLRNTQYADYKDYIKIIGTEHDYEAVNALIGSSMFSVNFSTKEGWEHRRAESMLKGVPSISSDSGGLPMQGADGQGGFVAEMKNLDPELDRIADEIVADRLDPTRHEQRKLDTLAWAQEYVIPELTTVPNIIRQVRIMNGKGDTVWRIKDMLKARAAKMIAGLEALPEAA